MDVFNLVHSLLCRDGRSLFEYLEKNHGVSSYFFYVKYVNTEQGAQKIQFQAYPFISRHALPLIYWCFIDISI